MRKVTVVSRVAPGRAGAGADEIQTASVEAVSASMDLSRRTEETAAQLQRASGAMPQIGTTVQHTAATTSDATATVQGNARVAQTGGGEVDAIVSTMEGVQTSSP